MIKEESKILKVYNPFSDLYEDLVCKLELHFDRKGQLDGVNVISIVVESGIDLMGYLNVDNIPAEIESNFVEAYNV